jgi:NADH dehydrogenase [ubiquinone] 1 alpha subcomplex assembly factor 7
MTDTPLKKIIIERIKQKGPMNIAEYMGLCLSHPEYGYYMTRDPFGVKGDFTTAPEISQLFGEMIGAWVADTWMKMGAPQDFILLECGPGRGTLMSDILRATKNVAGFHDAAHLHLLEISPVLQQRQADTLEGYEVTWHHDLASLPKDYPLIVVGNEFLDAFPVHQLTFSVSGWQEKMIEININDTLRFTDVLAEKQLTESLTPFLIPPKEGELVEVSPEQKAFLGDLMNIIIKQGGSALFVDYGFNHNVAGDTVQAVKDHAYCHILEYAGEADITAHVNFAEISRIAMEKTMTVHGPVSQSDYLQRLGISIRQGLLGEKTDEMGRRKLAQDVTRLIGTDTSKNEMGQLFKVMAFSSDPQIELAGFA